MPDINAFRINSMAPFIGQRDCAEERLKEAHALCVLLADINLDQGDAFTSLNDDLRRSAISGIGHLIAYAQYHLDCAAAADEEQAKPTAVAA